MRDKGGGPHDAKGQSDVTHVPKGPVASCLGCHFPRHHQQSHQEVQDDLLCTLLAKAQDASTHQDVSQQRTGEKSEEPRTDANA